MRHDDLNTLIGRVALSDRKAFVSLYKQTSPKLFSICLRILKDRTDADEALQEVYVKIWQRARLFSAMAGTPESWLATVARNQSIDMIRMRKPIASELDDVPDLADGSPDPEQATLNRDMGRSIDLCLAELEDSRADAVRHAYLDGMSYQELAERYAVPLNTMRTWLRRSLIKLKECMER
ncbi:sigma-70 family RNA polymerase sigma factor [Agrobacterium sp. rho-13.3]|jgi:RNA polymerase sigma-70 factor (ECF subfamily)|uniref:sigma-70 family RNA polymerase sigma factor n=1 Tax=Agrobacterium sp. rho-13.3 TaxID=3072980 RepID=UPI002A152A56|nr:sigma-70 family RNA polymerase sigma factor [Agrobacterium sp. rho-13.3]MDX8311049.1 sigma-70 family RNA polymerase sigma factor [Agrobacterium sp. rho-13.3]